MIVLVFFSWEGLVDGLLIEPLLAFSPEINKLLLPWWNLFFQLSKNTLLKCRGAYSALNDFSNRNPIRGNHRIRNLPCFDLQ